MSDGDYTSGDLANMRLYELRELAREQGIAGFSKARKDQLVEALANGYQRVQGETSGRRSGYTGQSRQSYNRVGQGSYGGSQSNYGRDYYGSYGSYNSNASSVGQSYGGSYGSRDRTGQSYSGNRYSDYSNNYGNVGQSNDYDNDYTYGNYASSYNYGSRVGQSNYGSRGRTGYGSRGRY